MSQLSHDCIQSRWYAAVSRPRSVGTRDSSQVSQVSQAAGPRALHDSRKAAGEGLDSPLSRLAPFRAAGHGAVGSSDEILREKPRRSRSLPSILLQVSDKRSPPPSPRRPPPPPARRPN